MKEQNIDAIKETSDENNKEENFNELKNFAESEKKVESEDSIQSSELDINNQNNSEKENLKIKNPNAKWYILQAYAGYEGRVEKTIFEKLKIANIENLVEEIFIPSEEIIRTKGGKKRKINQKYFPGYILIQMELTPDLWHLLMNIDRVSGFVGGTKKEPLPLAEEELKEIRNQIIDGFHQAAEEEEYNVGQKVIITEGPFSNFNGVINEINPERRKLKVLVSIFGRPTPVEVEFEKVKNT